MASRQSKAIYPRIPPIDGMAEALGRASPIAEEKRWTVWYVWRCPRPPLDYVQPKQGGRPGRCRKKIEATVRGYVLVLAERHVKRHDKVVKQRKAVAEREAALAVPQDGGE